MFSRLGIRRYSPATTRSVDQLRGEVAELRREMERLGRKGDTAALEEAIAALRQQSQEILKELRTTNAALARLTVRESQLRAVLERDGDLDPDGERLERTITRPGIEAHVAAAIDRAELRLEPFPHVVVDDLLPRDLYKALLKGLPPLELFADKVVNKQQIGVPFRLGPAYGRRVWRFMADVVVREYLMPRVLDKFRAPVQAWLAESWPELDLAAVTLDSSDGRIMLRRRGYVIPPHRDPKWGFITCLLYLARPEDNQAWGTQLYSVEADEQARGDAPYWIDPQRCRQEADVAYKANRVLIFLNSAGAHGASIPDDAPESLERYLYQFRIGPTRDSITTLSATLPAEHKALWEDSPKSSY